MSPFWMIVFATTVAVDVRSGIGATHDLAQRGVGLCGRYSVMEIGWFCRNAVGPPKWEFESMGSVVWLQCANLWRVYLIY